MNKSHPQVRFNMIHYNSFHLGKIALTFVVFCLFSNFFITAQTISAPAVIHAERIAEIDQPIQVLSASLDPNDDALLLVGHDGIIHYWEPVTGLRATPFMDLSSTGLDIVDFGVMSEQGMNGMTLDLNFAENGLFYVMYNGYRPDGTGELIDERILCFGTSADHKIADTSVWSEVLELVQPDMGHNGGQILFGADNFLYISTGDGGSTGSGEQGGGSGGDNHGPIGNAQNLESLLGKILRIDVHGLEPYTIPTDNPFVDNLEARDEIWAYGLRNPWRWSFDRETGDMYIGDVGEVDWEEINFEPAGSQGGLNYGWRLMEGSDCYEPLLDCDPGEVITLPIFEFPHENGLCSVIGGVVYRGSNIPSLQGYYVLSDACGFGDTQFFTLKADNNQEWISAPLVLDVENGFEPWTETKFAFGEDNKGEIYLCTRFFVYKLMFDPVFPPVTPGGEEVRFLPNPTAPGSLVRVDLNSGAEIESLKIFDSSGRLTRELFPTPSGDNASFYTKGFPNGVYAVHINIVGSEDIVYGKLVVYGE